MGWWFLSAASMRNYKRGRKNAESSFRFQAVFEPSYAGSSRLPIRPEYCAAFSRRPPPSAVADFVRKRTSPARSSGFSRQERDWDERRRSNGEVVPQCRMNAELQTRAGKRRFVVPP